MSPPDTEGVTNIEQFLKYLKGPPGVGKPVDVMYVVSHAGVDGFLAVDLDTEPEGTDRVDATNTKELLDAEVSGSVKIDASLIDGDTKFRIRGCEIGQNTKFLGLLKAALGGSVPVNAPVFFDSFQQLTSDAGLHGVLEWFNYSFLIRRPKRFANRAQALTEYKAKTASFKFIDGSTVPATRWKEWLPPATDSIWTDTRLGVLITERSNVVPLGQTVLGLKTLDASSFMTAWESRLVTKLPDLKASDPATEANPRLETEAEMRTFAKARLPTQERFTPAYPLPVYELFGFSTLDLMIDAMPWKIEMTNAEKGERRLVGTQFEYAVGPPVLDGSGNLVFNFQPGPAAPPGTATITGALETDPKIFATV